MRPAEEFQTIFERGRPPATFYGRGRGGRVKINIHARIQKEYTTIHVLLDGAGQYAAPGRQRRAVGNLALAVFSGSSVANSGHTKKNLWSARFLVESKFFFWRHRISRGGASLLDGTLATMFRFVGHALESKSLLNPTEHVSVRVTHMQPRMV